MAQFTSYDTIGAKEDVSDVITNITPTDTPFQSSIRTEKVQARTFFLSKIRRYFSES